MISLDTTIDTLTGGRVERRPVAYEPQHTARAVRRRQAEQATQDRPAGTVYRSAAATPEEVGPTDCTCWATSRNGCPVHYVRESRLRTAGPVRALAAGKCPVCGAWLGPEGTCTSPICFNRVEEA